MVVESGAALLGLNLFVALHTCIESNVSTDPGLTAPAAPPLIAPEAQVKEVGCANGFVHKPHAIPVQQKLRRLPFTVREAVTEEF